MYYVGIYRVLQRRQIPGLCTINAEHENVCIHLHSRTYYNAIQMTNHQDKLLESVLPAKS